MVDELKAIVEGLQEQNRILQSQIDEARKDSEEAKKEGFELTDDLKKEIQTEIDETIKGE